MSADEESPESRTPEDAERRPVTAPTATDASEDGRTEATAAAPPQAATPPAPAIRDRPPAAPAERPYAGPVLIGPLPARPDRWRTPAGGAPPYLAFACAAVALFGGWAAFHDEGVGIGLALTGVAATAVPMAAGGREGLAVRLPGAILVAGLWSVAAVRDAGWIVALCALTALLLTPLVLAPPSRFSGVLSAILGHLGGLAGAFRWMHRGLRRPDEAGNAMRNLRVAAITAGLLVVFGGLFAAADSGFAAIAANLVPEVDPFTLFVRATLSVLLFGVLLLWAYASAARPRFDPEEPSEPRPASRFEVAVPLGALNLLFAAFIALQARTLYGGDEYVMETAGLTMAEYARSGFWQLSVVAVLALAVIAVAAWKAPRRARADRWVARVLLGGLCLMSLAVVASAMFRMSRYFESFGLTRLRLWVFTVEIWLAVLFVLVLLCCWKLRATWLPRAILGSGAAVLLGLAAINPDGVIAKYNVDRFEQTGRFDPYYAAGLSADAADALAGLPQDERECVFGDVGWRHGDRPALAWNLGWAHGAALAEEYPVRTAHECPGYDRYGWDLSDERSAPAEAPAEAEAATDAADAAGPPAASAFFHWDTCDRLELSDAEELFGVSAKGDYGVEPDESRHNAWTAGVDGDDTTPYAHLECGYYGPGTRYLIAVVEQWDDAAQAGVALDRDRGFREGTGYEVADLGGETTAGFTAVYDDASRQELKCAFADEDLVFAVSIVDGPVDDAARQVCEDLGDQLHALAQEHD
ncbi:MAG TPA: DUF4173 domain-containing protein [Glycomyces sp.]|nr:DUF4173 domain-containing protein [Glycomyces sp.]